MQRMNYNETNGIVIGPEFSRIFAEVILQQVDNNVLSKLAHKKIYNNVDYQCFRYVDDYFFFYNNDEVKTDALTFFVNELKTYKLAINDAKTQHYERPFITNITRAKLEIDNLVDRTFSYKVVDKIDSHVKELELENVNEDIETNTEVEDTDSAKNVKLLEKALHNKDTWYLKSIDFNKHIKALLVTYQVEGKDVYNYTLARITRKIESGLKSLIVYSNDYQ